jgi:hypothetical protein
MENGLKEATAQPDLNGEWLERSNSSARFIWV